MLPLRTLASRLVAPRLLHSHSHALAASAWRVPAAVSAARTAWPARMCAAGVSSRSDGSGKPDASSSSSSSDHPADDDRDERELVRANRGFLASSPPIADDSLPPPSSSADSGAPLSYSSSASASGSRSLGGGADSLPDLEDYPPDEDPSITAARIMAREDVRREKEQKEWAAHWMIVGSAIVLAYGWHIYRCHRDNLPYFQTWLEFIPKSPGLNELPDADPAAENGLLWQALRKDMPHLKPRPELLEQWKEEAARKEVEGKKVVQPWEK